MGCTHRISSAADSSRLHDPRDPMTRPDPRSTKLAAAATREEQRRLEPNPGEAHGDAQRLKEAMVHLQESGWYWGAMTASEAKEVLSEAPEGSFLVRDSSTPGHLLTLSVSTALGPTHLRLEFAAGHFTLAAAAGARPRLRRFRGVLQLVQHYAQASHRQASRGQAGMEVPAPDGALELRLRTPRLRVPRGLQHLCRVLINRHARDHHELPLPTRLKDFLQEYPFTL